MMGLRWAALGVLWLPLAEAQPEPACAVPEGGTEAPRECPPPPRYPSPLEVLLSGGGILGSFLLLRKT